MKEGLYFLNETLRKSLFEIFKLVNDPTLVDQKSKKSLMAYVEWPIASSRASIFAKCAIDFLRLIHWRENFQYTHNDMRMTLEPT